MSQAHHPLQAPAPLKWPNWYLTGLKFAVLLLLSLLITLLWLLRSLPSLPPGVARALKRKIAP